MHHDRCSLSAIKSSDGLDRRGIAEEQIPAEMSRAPHAEKGQKPEGFRLAMCRSGSSEPPTAREKLLSSRYRLCDVEASSDGQFPSAMTRDNHYNPYNESSRNQCGLKSHLGQPRFGLHKWSLTICVGREADGDGTLKVDLRPPVPVPSPGFDAPPERATETAEMRADRGAVDSLLRLTPEHRRASGYWAG